jgi:hypothetical protein
MAKLDHVGTGVARTYYGAGIRNRPHARTLTPLDDPPA